MKIRALVIDALLTAILFSIQILFAALPNIELVSLFLILYTLTFPLRRVFGIVYVFALLEGLFYGFGIWWLMYLYVWPLLVLIAYLMRRNHSLILWAVLSGGFGLTFGALCAIPYGIAGGIYAGISYWISGIPFDIAHCIGNVVVLLLLFRPLSRCLCRLERKPGWGYEKE